MMHRPPSHVLLTLFSIIVAATPARAADAPAAPALKLTVSQTSLGKLQPGARPDLMVFSRDGRHVAYPVKLKDGWRIVVDGVEGKTYEWILTNTLIFTPDSQKVAFIVQKGEEMSLVRGDEESKLYGEIIPLPTLLNRSFPAAFSRDGKRVGFIARPAGKNVHIAVIDGVEGKEYEKINRILFSPDGKRTAVRVQRSGQWMWIVDGQEGKAWEAVGPLEFSPDSSRYAYMAEQKDKQTLIVDGQEGKFYDRVGGIAFSTDGKRLVHAAVRNRKYFVVTDGTEGKEYDLVGEPRLSPDGKHIAYEATRGRKSMVVLDGEEGRIYDQVGDAIFSQEGNHLFYVAVAERKWIFVRDTTEGKEYDRIGIFSISPDGNAYAYAARSGTTDLMVFNDREMPGAGSITMSPNGRYVAHAKDEPTAPGQPARSVLMINEVRGGEFGGFLRGSPWVWETPQKLVLMAGKANEIFRVEVKISEQQEGTQQRTSK